jgi:hypothetical protein
MARSDTSLHPMSHTRRSLLAGVLLGVMLLSLGAAYGLVHLRPPQKPAATPSEGAAPQRLTMFLQNIPADLKPLDGLALNLPIQPVVAMYRADSTSSRRLYIFSIRGVDYTAPDALEQTSQMFFTHLIGAAPAETIDKTIANRPALEMHQTPRNGIGFIWMRTTLVFDHFYAVYYAGNSSADDHDTDEFSTVCDNIRVRDLAPGLPGGTGR